jgi:hypothetical protein
MIWYIVRIELPDKPPGDYIQLHRDMFAARYYTYIDADDGTLWHLPHGTYYTSVTGRTIVEIVDEVAALAKRSHPHPRVFVAEFPRARWRGLRPVTAVDPLPDYS